MKKTLVVLIAALLLTLPLFGCAKTETLRTVQLHEVTRSVFYAPQYIAISKGFFEEQGLKVELTTSGGSDKAMTALLSGEADVCLSGPETGVYVYNEGKADHPVIVGQLTKRDGSFLISRVNEGAAFQWENLRGASIIGGRAGGMPLMTLEYVLRQHNIEPGVDAEVIDSVQFNLMAGAFEGGMGDYVTLFEPTATEFQNAGKGFIVAAVGQESGNIPYTAYLVRQETLKNDAEFVKKFITAIHQAQRFVQTASDEEIAEAMQPFFPDASMESLKIVASSYRAIDAWKTDPVMYEEDFNRLLDVIDGAGELSARPDFAKLVDNTIAYEVLGGGK